MPIHQNKIDHELKKKQYDYSVAKLKSLLDTASYESHIIIAIGSCCDSADNWQENIGMDSSEVLLINIDSTFVSKDDPEYSALRELRTDNGISTQTENKKYIRLCMDESVAESIQENIAQALNNKQCSITLCDFRRGYRLKDTMFILDKNLEHYRGPDDDSGGLVYLQGYFCCFNLVFWLDKNTISDDYQRGMHNDLGIMSLVSQSISKQENFEKIEERLKETLSDGFEHHRLIHASELNRLSFLDNNLSSMFTP